MCHGNDVGLQMAIEATYYAHLQSEVDGNSLKAYSGERKYEVVDEYGHHRVEAAFSAMEREISNQQWYDDLHSGNTQEGWDILEQYLDYHHLNFTPNAHDASVERIAKLLTERKLT